MNPETQNNFAGSAAGLMFAGPATNDRTMPLSNGLTLTAFRQSGVIISTDTARPTSGLTLFTQGTAITNEEGALIVKAELHEMTDPDGDSVWAIGANRFDDGAPTACGKFRLVQGTGKWQGVSGFFGLTGLQQARADEHVMVNCETQWAFGNAGRASYEDLVNKGNYTNYDTGFSFHGAHVDTRTVELSTGLRLVANTQSGVLLSNNPDSPRHNATCYDRGTTIKTSENKTLGDIMLLEDTDADGDVVWLYHEWWYDQGPGSYEFIAGTGKWRGISGIGRTLGMVAQRADDHYMPSWEMHWKLNS